jgi:hypothetical protein
LREELNRCVASLAFGDDAAIVAEALTKIGDEVRMRDFNAIDEKVSTDFVPRERHEKLLEEYKKTLEQFRQLANDYNALLSEHKGHLANDRLLFAQYDKLLTASQRPERPQVIEVPRKPVSCVSQDMGWFTTVNCY